MKMQLWHGGAKCLVTRLLLLSSISLISIACGNEGIAIPSHENGNPCTTRACPTLGKVPGEADTLRDGELRFGEVASEPLDVEAAMEELLKWLRMHGASGLDPEDNAVEHYVVPTEEVKKAEDASTGGFVNADSHRPEMGMRAKGDIYEHQLLFSIPKELIISSDSVADAEPDLLPYEITPLRKQVSDMEEGGDVNEKNRNDMEEDDDGNEKNRREVEEEEDEEFWVPYTVLAAWLLREKAKGKDSFWYPFMRVLPPYVQSPILFSKEVLDVLGYRRLAEQAEHMLSEYRREYNKCRKESIANASFSEFAWAMSVLASRGFAVEISPDSEEDTEPTSPLNSTRTELGDFASAETDNSGSGDTASSDKDNGGSGDAAFSGKDKGGSEDATSSEEDKGGNEEASTDGTGGSPSFIPWGETGLKRSRFEKPVMMVPYVDLLNHDFETINTIWKAIGGAFHVISYFDIPKGKPLVSTYGEKSSDEYLLAYGFVPASNTHDYIVLFESVGEAIAYFNSTTAAAMGHFNSSSAAIGQSNSSDAATTGCSNSSAACGIGPLDSGSVARGIFSEEAIQQRLREYFGRDRDGSDGKEQKETTKEKEGEEEDKETEEGEGQEKERSGKDVKEGGGEEEKKGKGWMVEEVAGAAVRAVMKEVESQEWAEVLEEYPTLIGKDAETDILVWGRGRVEPRVLAVLAALWLRITNDTADIDHQALARASVLYGFGVKETNCSEMSSWIGEAAAEGLAVAAHVVRKRAQSLLSGFGSTDEEDSRRLSVALRCGLEADDVSSDTKEGKEGGELSPVSKMGEKEDEFASEGGAGAAGGCSAGGEGTQEMQCASRKVEAEQCSSANGDLEQCGPGKQEAVHTGGGDSIGASGDSDTEKCSPFLRSHGREIEILLRLQKHKRTLLQELKDRMAWTCDPSYEPFRQVILFGAEIDLPDESTL